MKVKAENFITIPGWAALPPYNLKGNDLIIFAIIYGFCQVKGQCFCGSLAYLQEWTNSTRTGVIKNLKNLVEKGLVIKLDCKPTNHYIVNPVYNTIFEDNSVNNDDNNVSDGVNSVNEDSELSKHNNINNNIDINNYTKAKQMLTNSETIITYMNKVCHTNFRSSTSVNKKLVNKLITEGFTIDDIKKVIDYKYETWGKKPFKFQNGSLSNEYLRPSTLFGDKFESYLYEAESKKVPVFGDSQSVKASGDVSDFIL